ncbi:MAG: phosphoglycerate kinase [bacterium]|nr:phosphoglycerate kinase [bacterium]
MKTLKDLTVDNKTVLVRVDFNVPIDETGQVMDASRIEAVKPTIDYLRERNAKVVLLAHFGRPKGKVVDELRFKPIIPVVSEVLGCDVAYVQDCIGKEVEAAVAELPVGGVLLLENVRFYVAEKDNDPEFAKQLASLGDLYVNDAFGAAHRAHASTAGVADLLPHAAGLLMQREVEELTHIVENPAEPVVAIIGGSKISTKMNLINSLLPKVEYLLLGGALANTVLMAQNHKIGKSLVEEELSGTVKDLLSNKLRVPVDVVVAKEIKEDAEKRVVAVGKIEEDDYALDIGPDTVGIYSDCIKKAKTIIWNGPMGVFEMESFAMGTYHIAKVVGETDAYSVIGGGETVSAVKKVGLEDQISFISTGGGAMLEFLEGNEMPGIKALD